MMGMTVEPTVSTATTSARKRRIPADTFSNRLLLARRLAGMTIEQAAAACALNKSSWANWENGKRPHDRPEVCGVISEVLDVDFNWLLLGGPLESPSGRPTNRPASNTDGYWAGRPRPSTGCVPYPAPTVQPIPTMVRPPENRPKSRQDRSHPMSQPVTGRRAALVR